MFKDIYENLRKNGICLNDKRVVAGFSGGSDSMFLMMFLLYCRKNHKLSFKFVHFNHKEREAAFDEEIFVKKICKTHKIELSLYSDDTMNSERTREKGFEMAGREARRKAFIKEKNDFNADYIMTGHHLDDAVETFFLNIERGTGVRGINSMKLLNGYFVKPFIHIKKKVILDYLKTKKIQYITDETNKDEKFARNRIRHNLIPALESTIRNGLVRFDLFFENTNSVIDLFDHVIEKEMCILKNKNPLILDISKILYYNNKLRQNLLYYILSREIYVDSSMIAAIDSMISSKKPNISVKMKGLTVEKAYSEIIIKKSGKEEYTEEKLLSFGKQTEFNGWTILIVKENFKESLLKEKNLFVFPLDSGNKFKVRVLKNSDRFVPFGMETEKKVSRFLMDSKVSLLNRKIMPLLVNEKEEILAVGSLRRTNLYKIKKQKGCICYYVGKS